MVVESVSSDLNRHKKLMEAKRQMKHVAASRDLNAKGRARRMGVEYETTRGYIVWLLVKEPECFWCHQPVAQKDKTVDHIRSLDNGGTHTKDNLVMACHRCNDRRNRVKTHNKKLGIQVM